MHLMLQVDAGAALTMVNALLDCVVAHDRACPLTTPTVASAEARAMRAGYLGILPTITADDQDPNPGVKKATERWLWSYMANRVVDWNDSVAGAGMAGAGCGQQHGQQQHMRLFVAYFAAHNNVVFSLASSCSLQAVVLWHATP